MGFGTLFIGYFLLINVTHFFFTDIIAAIVMLMGAYKLSRFNKGFYCSFIFCGVFSVFSAVSFVFNILTSFFDVVYLDPSMPYISMSRHLLVFAITLSAFIGIYATAREVDAKKLAITSAISIPLSSVFIFNAALEIPHLAALTGVYVRIFYGIAILTYIVVVAANLVTIYRAYMQICLPEDLEPTVKKSRGIFTKFAEYEEKKSREYAEYKLNKKIEKAKRKKKK